MALNNRQIQNEIAWGFLLIVVLILGVTITMFKIERDLDRRIHAIEQSIKP